LISIFSSSQNKDTNKINLIAVDSRGQHKIISVLFLEQKGNLENSETRQFLFSLPLNIKNSIQSF